MTKNPPLSIETPAELDANVAGVFPLSFSQESVWLEEQISPGSTYNMPEAWHLKGPLNVPALLSALNALVQRHEALRTTVQKRDGKPVQVVHAIGKFPLAIVNVAGRPALDEGLRKLVEMSARTPFDLEQGPLACGTLYRFSADDHLLLINTHHIISDAWSQAVFMRDLAALYATEVSGHQVALPEMPIQFADFAAWQRETAHTTDNFRQVEYWTKQLQGFLPPASPPHDFQRGGVRKTHSAGNTRPGITHFDVLEEDLVERLEFLARKHQVTLFTLLLAAFQTLLHRYTGHDDIIVGCPLSGRDRPEAEPLIGMFVNTHAIRTNFGDNPTFLELIDRVRRAVLNAHENQCVSLEQIIAALKPERVPQHHPFFQVVFGMQSQSADAPEFPGLEARRIELDNGAAKFDWTLLLSRSNAGVSVRSECDTALYNSNTGRRLVQHYFDLLRTIVRDPSRRVSELSWAGAEERRKTLITWNQTERPYETDLTVGTLFEMIARAHPEKPALTFRGRHTTYRELNTWADQLARMLVSGGVKPGSKVAVRLNRSPELIAAILGILKTGAAYVPLDPSYPVSRQEFMIRDSGAETVVTDTCHPAPAGARAICLPAREGFSETQTWSTPRTEPRRAAYVMYTSGSTGTPKGVVVPHRAIIRLVRNTNYVAIDQDSVFLHLSSPSFDASTFEIWGALLNGARVVLFPNHIPSLAELGRTITNEGVNTLWLTAGLFNQLVDNELQSLSGVKQLLTGGEALSVRHVAKACLSLPETVIINGYGPTENTTFSCCHRIDAQTLSHATVLPATIPIGRPIANSQAYILDAHLSPCPIGVPGELWVGGDGLAVEYVGQPELTAQKFITAGLEGIRRQRLYRTGDIARWLEDGTIEFLGRRDHQLKLRGFRIEPGEIESAILQCEGIKSALVHVVGQDLTRRLVAYVIPQNDAQISTKDLLDSLRARLPAYMVPSAFVTLQQLPLTPNGKVDRRALPLPADEIPETVTPPRTDQEKLVSMAWAEVLGRDGFDVRQNFFQLGGHSLLATQVASRLSQLLSTEVPVGLLFDFPTIESLATALPERGTRTNPEEPLLVRQKDRRRVQELLAHLDDLSDAELDELLKLHT